MAPNLTLWSQHKKVYTEHEAMKKQPKCLSLLFIWNNLMLIILDSGLVRIYLTKSYALL